MWFRRSNHRSRKFRARTNQGSRYSIIFDFEMRLRAVLRAGRVVQSRSSYSKPVGGTSSAFVTYRPCNYAALIGLANIIASQTV
jgi:hypothetical protein